MVAKSWIFLFLESWGQWGLFSIQSGVFWFHFALIFFRLRSSCAFISNIVTIFHLVHTFQVIGNTCMNSVSVRSFKIQHVSLWYLKKISKNFESHLSYWKNIYVSIKIWSSYQRFDGPVVMSKIYLFICKARDMNIYSKS